MSNPSITQEYLKELFFYNGEKLIWCCRRSRIKLGAVAGGIQSDGYIRITVNQKHYQAHRLIWLWVYGEWPDGEIDHINGIRDDNRIDNLRAVTRSENCRNTKQRKDNKSGITGVHWHKKAKKWQARIQTNGKTRNLGLFDCKYRAASIRHFSIEIEGGFTYRHGK